MLVLSGMGIQRCTEQDWTWIRSLELNGVPSATRTTTSASVEKRTLGTASSGAGDKQQVGRAAGRLLGAQRHGGCV